MPFLPMDGLKVACSIQLNLLQLNFHRLQGLAIQGFVSCLLHGYLGRLRPGFESEVWKSKNYILKKEDTRSHLPEIVLMQVQS